MEVNKKNTDQPVDIKSEFQKIENKPQDTSSQPQLAQQPETQPVVEDKQSVEVKTKKKFIIPLLVLLLLIAAGAAVYFGYIYYLSKQIDEVKPTPVVFNEPTNTPDPFINWKTYSNSDERIAFKYPHTWKLETFSSQIFRLNLTKDNYVIDINKPDGWSPSVCEYSKKDQPIVQSTYFDIYQEIQTQDGVLRRSRNSKHSNQIWYICYEENQDGKYTTYLPFGGSIIYKIPESYDETYLKEMDLILSTFEFTTIQPTTQPGPPDSVINYPRPASWETVNIVNHNISICLPPKWESDEWGHVIFNRDPGYKPRVMDFNKHDYEGGSRREEYINLKVQYEYEPEKLKNETKVNELSINGRSVLKISIPSFPEALVFVLNDELYEAQLASHDLVNDSQSLFLNDVYTVVGCVKPL